MNMRDYSTLHLDISAFIAVLHFTVTVVSPTMSKTHILR